MALRCAESRYISVRAESAIPRAIHTLKAHRTDQNCLNQYPLKSPHLDFGHNFPPSLWTPAHRNCLKHNGGHFQNRKPFSPSSYSLQRLACDRPKYRSSKPFVERGWKSSSCFCARRIQSMGATVRFRNPLACYTFPCANCIEI